MKTTSKILYYAGLATIIAVVIALMAHLGPMGQYNQIYDQWAIDVSRGGSYAVVIGLCLMGASKLFDRE